MLVCMFERREKASQLPPGKEKDDLLRRARLADMASHLDDRAAPRLAACSRQSKAASDGLIYLR